MKHGMTGRLALAAITAVVLAACGSSGGGDVSGSTVTLNGLTATGAAMDNAAVAARCVSGGGSTNSAADGTFTVTLADSVLPCVVQVRQNEVTLHGFAMQGGRVNVTPLTELLIARAIGGDPAQAFANFDAARAAALQSGLGMARTYVQDQASALAGGLITGDPLTKPFAIGDADDRLLDNLVALLAQAGRTVADLAAVAAAAGDLRAAMPPEESRPHDRVAYFISPGDATATTFAALPAAAGDAVDMNTTSRWAGVLEGAAWRIEVPANWNGELVMYAHGYAGEGLELRAVDSAIRRHLVQRGYAWAASSYSRNSYDVRAGIEDTNLLAKNFNAIAAARGLPLAAPSRTYIVGHSMGGHVAAAAVEAETYATARHKVRYDGAMPMCGVVGDTTLFDTFAGMQGAAHVLGGRPSAALDQWSSIRADVTTALFGATTLAAPITPTPIAGMAYASVLQNLTGGPRPLFDLGLGVGSLTAPYGLFGTTTVTTGLTTKSVSDTTRLQGRRPGRSLGRPEQCRASGRRPCRRQPAALGRAALDSQGEWPADGSGGLHPHAGRSVRAVRHAAGVPPARRGQRCGPPARATGHPRRVALRLHHRRDVAVVRRHGGVGEAGHRSRGRRRAHARDGGEHDLRLRAHE